MSKAIYEMVTKRIIEQLENNVIPWHRPWTGTQNGAYNRVTKKSYSLLNQMLLQHSGEYATFKQWSDLGGKVRKGEKSEIIVFWKVYPKEQTNADGEKEVVNIPILKYINVFHISQIDGIEPLKEEEREQIEPIEKAESVLNDYWNREHIQVKYTAQNRAFYSPDRDFIQLPLFEQFESAEEYYSTAFHESVHSTMIKSRCDREEQNKIVAFGGDDYSKEELTAEIGSANLMNIIGIETKSTFKNSTAYIQSWLRVLKNDIKFIVSASSKAEKAVNYILNIAE